MSQVGLPQGQQDLKIHFIEQTYTSSHTVLAFFIWTYDETSKRKVLVETKTNDGKRASYLVY